MKRFFFVPLFLAATPALAQPTPPDPTGGEQPPPVTPPVPPTQPEPPQPPHREPPPVEEPPPPPQPEKKEEHKITVSSKWDLNLYGFVEADFIADSTQGLLESVGNGAIPRPHTYAGDHGDLTYGARNSRFGFKLAAPEYSGVRASAQLELDFLGNQPGKPFDSTGLVSEAATFQNPVVRYRHAYVKLETDYVDILFGQYWELFGMQPYFFPNTVEIQGVVGQVYSRTPQIRISKTIKTPSVVVDLAVAASRPPERGAATPDGQAGIKIGLENLKGWTAPGSTGGQVQDAAIGVSVIGRHFAVDEFAAAPSSQVTTNGYGISLDALIPLHGGTKENHGNAVTLTGSFVRGAGIADLYTGLNFGVANPALPNPTMANPAPTFTPNIDPGLAMYMDNGKLLAVKSMSYIVGAQWFLPPKGHLFLSVDYGHIESPNSIDFGSTAKSWNNEDWYSANLFWDITPAARLGICSDFYDMTFNDKTEAKNYREQLSAFFIF